MDRKGICSTWMKNTSFTIRYMKYSVYHVLCGFAQNAISLVSLEEFVCNLSYGLIVLHKKLCFRTVAFEYRWGMSCHRAGKPTI